MPIDLELHWNASRRRAKSIAMKQVPTYAPQIRYGLWTWRFGGAKVECNVPR